MGGQMRGAALAVLVGVGPAVALAGGSAVIESAAENPFTEGAEQTRTRLVWQDQDTVRLEMPGDADSMIVRDGEAYVITTQGGQTQVIDMATMMSMMGGSADADDRADAFGTVEAVQATGGIETVAGVAGELYRVTATDWQGETTTDEWVLTDHPLVVEMTRAYYGSARQMLGAAAGEDSLADWEDMLPEGKTGVLRVGGDYRVVSISAEDPAASAFDLPAEPMDLRSMLGGN